MVNETTVKNFIEGVTTSEVIAEVKKSFPDSIYTKEVLLAGYYDILLTLKRVRRTNEFDDRIKITWLLINVFVNDYSNN